MSQEVYIMIRPSRLRESIETMAEMTIFVGQSYPMYQPHALKSLKIKRNTSYILKKGNAACAAMRLMVVE